MDNKNIKYPIYIVSKGRAYNPISARMFIDNNIDFKIVVEPQEYEQYLEKISKKNILVLPFKNLGLGSYPARNYCWEHSIKNGYKWHWIFDDNIYIIGTVKNGTRRIINHCENEAIVYIESFIEKFSNLAIIGFNYDYFITKETKKSFVVNTHVYSGMLIKNNLSFRWRLKYNEDVDLCLQALNRKLCTILFNKYYIKKVSTVCKLKGGNQTELYKNNDPKLKHKKAKMLCLQWPKYVKLVKRFNRPHHYINWRSHFNHKLILNKADLIKD